MKGLQQKNVLVTGGASGIGKAIALRFAQEGANVAINYHSNREQAEAVLKEVYGCAIAANYPTTQHFLIQADITQVPDIEKMFLITHQKLDSLDILINNAGIQIESPSDKVEIDSFDKVLGVNLRGAFLCSRQAIRAWLAENRAGVIINNSSVHEIIPRPQYLSYSVSKGGLENMTKTLALEYARDRIRINSIAPGATLTPINDWAEEPGGRQEIADFVPMGRAGQPEEMAAAAAFLASSEAAYITGQTLFIDGGLTLYPGFRHSIT